MGKTAGKSHSGSTCNDFQNRNLTCHTALLEGPTGERNSYQLLPRQQILCLATETADILCQLAAVLASGCRALWPDDSLHQEQLSSLPAGVAARISLDNQALTGHYDGVIFHGDADQLREVCQQVAARQGAIIPVQGLSKGETAITLERLLIERSLSINTAAAGGNASLMTIG